MVNIKWREKRPEKTFVVYTLNVDVILKWIVVLSSRTLKSLQKVFFNVSEKRHQCSFISTCQTDNRSFMRSFTSHWVFVAQQSIYQIYLLETLQKCLSASQLKVMKLTRVLLWNSIRVTTVIYMDFCWSLEQSLRMNSRLTFQYIVIVGPCLLLWKLLHWILIMWDGKKYNHMNNFLIVSYPANCEDQFNIWEELKKKYSFKTLSFHAITYILLCVCRL